MWNSRCEWTKEKCANDSLVICNFIQNYLIEHDTHSWNRQHSESDKISEFLQEILITFYSILRLLLINMGKINENYWNFKQTWLLCRALKCVNIAQSNTNTVFSCQTSLNETKMYYGINNCKGNPNCIGNWRYVINNYGMNGGNDCSSILANIFIWKQSQLNKYTYVMFGNRFDSCIAHSHGCCCY